MEKSESIKEIAVAMNKAQAEMSGAVKNSKSHYSTYADLYEVIQCIKEPFSNHGLSYAQFPLSEEGKAGVETILMHSSGEWISNTLMLKCQKNDPQGLGSAITYARRFSLQSIAGIPAVDDDAEAATAAQPKLSKEQIDALTAVGKANPAIKSLKQVNDVCRGYNANSLPDVLACYFDGVKKGLEGIK